MLTPMTDIEAVNAMLTLIGEQPVSSLLASGEDEVGIAKLCLEEASRDVQAQGWHFNTEIGLRLAPDTLGNIHLPANCARADATDRDARVDAVQRGTRLYDRRAQSFVFDRPVTVDLVSLLPFEELPQAARRYIAIKAARRFQERVQASGMTEEFALREEVDARAQLEDAEADTADYNILHDSAIPRYTLRRDRT